jgi:hypothetical protein
MSWLGVVRNLFIQNIVWTVRIKVMQNARRGGAEVACQMSPRFHGADALEAAAAGLPAIRMATVRIDSAAGP